MQSQWFASKSISLSSSILPLQLSLSWDMLALSLVCTSYEQAVFTLCSDRSASIFFQSFFIAPFSSCVELTFLFVQEKNILANVLLLWYTQAKEDLHCKLFSYSHLPISFILNNLLRIHFWTQDLDFSFCLSFGVLLTTDMMAPSSFLGNIIISTAWWKYPDDIRHPSCCWRGYLCIAQLVFWRKWGNLITIPIVSASHQSLFLSWPLHKKGRSDQVASKTRVALNKNGIFGILAHPWDH